MVAFSLVVGCFYYLLSAGWFCRFFFFFLVSLKDLRCLRGICYLLLF